MADPLRPEQAGTRGVQRLLRKQVGKALAALAGERPLTDEAVHDARKRLKKARALLRLLGEALGSRLCQRENACLRDAARPLTEVRDIKVLRDTLEEVAEQDGAQRDEQALDEVRRALRQDQEEVRRRVLEEGDALGPVRQALEEVRQRARTWPVGRHGWSVLGAGLKRVYRSGRDAFAVAQAEPSVETLHEWRKQVKYLWHQVQVLQPLWPALLEELADQAHTLADHLGADHDLAVLHAKLHEQPDRFPAATVAALAERIDRRRAELQEQSWPLGRRLFEEKPRTFVARLGGYWRTWKAEGRAGVGQT
jgi:CHAD domain-containing protein